MTLNQLKQNQDVLFAALNLYPADLNNAKTHDFSRGEFRCCCPLHGGKNPQALSIIRERDGNWVWRCHAGCKGGTFWDAIDKREGFNGDERKILAYMQQKLGLKLYGKLRPKDPVLNEPTARKFLNSLPDEIPADYLKKRGITPAVAKEFGLKFADHQNFTGLFHGYFQWAEKWTGWILPITVGGALKGLKAHSEIIRSSDQPKCFWLPFGIEKNEKGKTLHKVAALWPEIENRVAGFGGNPQDALSPGYEYKEAFLCPGELKALSFRSMGYMATSPTEAESATLYDEWLDQFETFENLYCAFDNDPTGRAFREMALAFLERVPPVKGKVRRAAAIDFSRGMQNESKKEALPSVPQPIRSNLVQTPPALSNSSEVVLEIEKEHSTVIYKNVTGPELRRLREWEGD